MGAREENDFAVEGIGEARKALTALAKQRSRSHGNVELKKAVVKALYTEIRDARAAGHGWKKIYDCISCIKTSIAIPALKKHFEDLDAHYEKTTGVKALPIIKSRGNTKGKE